MAELSPNAASLSFGLGLPLVRRADPLPNCWSMRWEVSLPGMILDGGEGALRYTTSRPFNGQGPNTFDVLLANLTGRTAPLSITVWPYSDSACQCDSFLDPLGWVYQLNPARPGISSHLAPPGLTLALGPAGPGLAETVSVDPVTLALGPTGPAFRTDLGPAGVDLLLMALCPGISSPLGPTGLTLALGPADPAILPDLGPDALALAFDLAGPALAPHLAPDALTLALGPAGPDIHTDLYAPSPAFVLDWHNPAFRKYLGPTPWSLDLNPRAPQIHENLEPDALALTFTLGSPAASITTDLEPSAATLALGPAGPKISSPSGPTDCAGAEGTDLTITLHNNSGCSCADGVSFTLPWDSGSSSWTFTGGTPTVCGFPLGMTIQCSSGHPILSSSSLLVSNVAVSSETYSPLTWTWTGVSGGLLCGPGTMNIVATQ